MSELCYLADNLLVYPLGKTWTKHWPRLTENNHWADQLRQLAREGTTWQFELRAPDGKIFASYKSHRGLEKRIEADEEEARDNALYDRIFWMATFQDGSGWHGTVPLDDWRALAWGLRSVHDDENQIINWLWIKVREAAEDQETHP